MATISRFLDDKEVSKHVEFHRSYKIEIKKLTNSVRFRWLVRFPHHTIVSNEDFDSVEAAEVAVTQAGY